MRRLKDRPRHNAAPAFLLEAVIRISLKKKRRYYLKLVKRINYLSIFLLFFTLSCENNSHIEQEKLAYIYVDLLVVEDYYSNSHSLAIKRNQVFEKHMTTEQDYDSTFKQFAHSREEWENFFAVAKVYLDSLKSLEKGGKLITVP